MNANVDDDRFKKLSSRIDEPLPNYNRDQINRQVKIKLDKDDGIIREKSQSDFSNGKKSKKAMDQESKRKTVEKAGRNQDSLNQLKLEQFYKTHSNNTIEKDVMPESIIEKRIITDYDRMQIDSNSSNSSQNDTNFLNFKNQNTKLDRFFPINKTKHAIEVSNQKNLFDDVVPIFVANEHQMLKSKVEKFQEKITALKEELERKSHEIKILRKEMKKKEEEAELKDLSKQDLLIELVLELEKYRKQDSMMDIHDQQRRLGERLEVNNWESKSKRKEVTWLDGWEISYQKQILSKIIANKQKLENKKKNLRSTKRGRGSVNSGPNEENLYDTEMSNEYNAGEDMLEKIRQIDSQIFFLNKQEQEAKDNLSRLENEKLLLNIKLKLTQEEKLPDYEDGVVHYPLFDKQYQLVGLLGKGGFSEVYKAFDLKEYKYKAFKLHKFQMSWDENHRQNYVKHAVREYDVHRSLQHPNIIRLEKCVEISETSFASILEY